ncbi:hypothetical protein BKA62DRAFT_770870 [Auriculariales sp. MPI-PUGE-AT-0066]|nr:hypothetical protein BKA62DRAFT_770870 [Auriculariales sp. MPI-PUGE-AT-0066]
MSLQENYENETSLVVDNAEMSHIVNTFDNASSTTSLLPVAHFASSSLLPVAHYAPSASSSSLPSLSSATDVRAFYYKPDDDSGSDDLDSDDDSDSCDGDCDEDRDCWRCRLLQTVYSEDNVSASHRSEPGSQAGPVTDDAGDTLMPAIFSSSAPPAIPSPPKTNGTFARGAKAISNTPGRMGENFETDFNAGAARQHLVECFEKAVFASRQDELARVTSSIIHGKNSAQPQRLLQAQEIATKAERRFTAAMEEVREDDGLSHLAQEFSRPLEEGDSLQHGSLMVLNYPPKSLKGGWSENLVWTTEGLVERGLDGKTPLIDVYPSPVDVKLGPCKDPNMTAAQRKRQLSESTLRVKGWVSVIARRQGQVVAFGEIAQDLMTEVLNEINLLLRR